MLKDPSSVDVVVRFSPVLSFTTSTAAPAIRAPAESATVPLILPVACAKQMLVAPIMTERMQKTCAIFLSIDFSFEYHLVKIWIQTGETNYFEPSKACSY